MQERPDRARRRSAPPPAGVPAGPINTLDQVFADPQVRHRGIAITADGVPGLRTPISFATLPLTLDRPAPRLGQHDEEARAKGARLNRLLKKRCS